MSMSNLFQNIKKIVFSSDLTLHKRIKIRDNLQYKFSEYIFTLNSENDLIIRKIHNARSASTPN